MDTGGGRTKMIVKKVGPDMVVCTSSDLGAIDMRWIDAALVMKLFLLL